MKKYIAFLFGFITLLTILLMNLTVAGDYICEDGVCIYHDEININSNPGGDDGGDNGDGTSPSSGGGGGGTTSYWECGEWVECSNEGIQTRTCEDLRGYEANRTETRGCIPSFLNEQREENESGEESVSKIIPQNFFTSMTGAVIGTLGKGGTFFVSIFLLLIIAGLIAMAINRRKA